jgi:hypothetical protein
MLNKYRSKSGTDRPRKGSAGTTLPGPPRPRLGPRDASLAGAAGAPQGRRRGAGCRRCYSEQPALTVESFAGKDRRRFHAVDAKDPGSPPIAEAPTEVGQSSMNTRFAGSQAAVSPTRIDITADGLDGAGPPHGWADVTAIQEVNRTFGDIVAGRLGPCDVLSRPSLDTDRPAVLLNDASWSKMPWSASGSRGLTRSA